MSRPTEFALRLRSPGWLAGPMQVSVNGQTVIGRHGQRQLGRDSPVLA